MGSPQNRGVQEVHESPLPTGIQMGAGDSYPVWQKAFDMYQDETVRKLVLAYGEEAEKLDEDRFNDFCRADENFDEDFYGKYNVDPKTYLKDSCLIYAGEYAQALFYLFGIKLKGDE